jgi:hypothetical protein
VTRVYLPRHSRLRREKNPRLGRVRRHFVSSVRAVGHRYAPAQAQAEVISSLARAIHDLDEAA